MKKLKKVKGKVWVRLIYDMLCRSCKQLFITHIKQKRYCSPKCKNKVNIRDYWKRRLKRESK